MKPTKKGECDACPKTDVDLYPVRDMFLCVTCYQAEVKAIEGTKWIDNALKNGRVIETPVELKQDIFVATTDSFIHLQMVIQADESIPQNKKTEVFLQKIEAWKKELSDAIFAEKAATAIKENARYSLSQQMKEFISKLQADEREKFKKYDTGYAPKPATPSRVRKAAGDKPQKSQEPRRKSIDVKACKEAAAKYGVASSWTSVQSIYVKKPGISYDAAAKQLAEMMGLLPTK